MPLGGGENLLAYRARGKAVALLEAGAAAILAGAVGVIVPHAAPSVVELAVLPKALADAAQLCVEVGAEDAQPFLQLSGVRLAFTVPRVKQSSYCAALGVEQFEQIDRRVVALDLEPASRGVSSDLPILQLGQSLFGEGLLHVSLRH